jgi:hypothetical protein
MIIEVQERDEVRATLASLSQDGRAALRRALAADQAERDAVAMTLLRYGDRAGNDWADLIDSATLDPELRGRLLRTLVEIEAG